MNNEQSLKLHYICFFLFRKLKFDQVQTTNKEKPLFLVTPFFKEYIRSVPFLYSTASVIFDDEYKNKMMFKMVVVLNFLKRIYRVVFFFFTI